MLDARLPRLFGSLWLLTAAALAAQDQPVNTSLVGRFDVPLSSYADVWGADGIAFMGRFGQRFVDLVDIRDPANPVLYATYDSGQPSASAQDVKAAGGLMFVGLEGGDPGCQIVDVRDPGNPIKLTDVSVRDNVHNVFYSEGWLYLVDSSAPVVDVVDLRAYDPDNPPATIDAAFWTLNNVGSHFVHDITVQSGRLYAAAWDSGLWVYDVSANATTMPSFLGSAPGNNTHSSWATDDGRFVVAAEERTGGGLTLFEVTEGTGSVTLTAVDSLVIDPGRSASVHNPVIVGDRVFASWYTAGVVVLDIDRQTATFEENASFDTSSSSPTGFAGCWGVFPFLGPDLVLASDRGNGLFVLSVPGSPIFSDSFESGNTAIWSATVP